MPRLVSELTQGRTFERSGENGMVSDSGQRQWRILLNSPTEGFDITQAIGVRIGDPFDPYNKIPCVGISVTADGEDRMVRLATARYASTPGQDVEDENNDPKDPGSVPPPDRLSVVKVSTSMMELPAWTWRLVNPDGTSVGADSIAVNPAGDLYDGVIKIEPLSVITVEQFDWPDDPTVHCQHVGKVNSNQAIWRGLTIPQRCLLFRGISFEPRNLYWGTTLYRGWQSSYEFVFRRNLQRVADPDLDLFLSRPIGWDMAIPQTGFNYLDAGKKKRAYVKVPGSDQEIPSAQPVPLNDDGSLRAENAAPKVLIYRWGVHEQVNFATAFAHLRLAAGM